MSSPLFSYQPIDSWQHFQRTIGYWRGQEFLDSYCEERQCTLVAYQTDSPLFTSNQSYQLTSNENFGLIESGYFNKPKQLTYTFYLLQYQFFAWYFSIDSDVNMGNFFQLRFATSSEAQEIKKAVQTGRAHFSQMGTAYNTNTVDRYLDRLEFRIHNHLERNYCFRTCRGVLNETTNLPTAKPV